MYAWNIFFHSFYTFGVMAHFKAEENFLDKCLATLFEYDSWDQNIVAFFFCEALLTINSEMGIEF